MVARLLDVPFLKAIGGGLLLWIAVGLLNDEADDRKIAEAHTIWRAVRTIVIPSPERT